MKDSFKIKSESHGIGGWIIYLGRSELRFPRELSGIKGSIITFPSREEWKEFCMKSNAEWAIDRRDQIIEQVARGAAKKLYWFGKYEIRGNWINVYPGWFL